MKYSELLESILAKAEEWRKERGFRHLSAALIVAACSEFRFSEYTGQNETYYPELYEEERLRYVYKKLFKLGGNLRAPYMSKLTQRPDELDVLFDFCQSEEIAKKRGKDILSADLVFLSALSMLPPQDRYCVPAYREALDVEQLMREIDANIYGYVVDQLSVVSAKLQKRLEEAIARRDWHPAKKFAEPEAVSHQFFDSVKVEYVDDILNLKIPHFFGEDELVLSIHWCKDAYYFHDNGCSFRVLKKNVGNEEKAERIIKKTCHPQWIKGKKIIGVFTDSRHFLYLLQRLIFIAHGDLYFRRLTRPIYLPNPEADYLDQSLAEPFDWRGLLNEFKEKLSFGYEEKCGLYFHVGTTYSLFSTSVSFLMETVEQSVRISDRLKGKTEGEIWEAFYWNHDDIQPYKRILSRYLKRFGAGLEGKDLYLEDSCEHWLPALFRFINLAVLLSEFGHEIELEKS